MKKYLLDWCVVKFIMDAGSRHTYVSSISYRRKINYSHCMKILRLLDKEGIIATHKIGRKRYINLTEKGRKFYNLLKEMNEVLKEK